MDVLIVDFEQLTCRPAFRNAFPNAEIVDRKAITMPIRNMKQFRDQIAHHKPIFNRDLDSGYKTLLEIEGRMSMESRRWVEELSLVPEVLAGRNDGNFLKF